MTDSPRKKNVESTAKLQFNRTRYLCRFREQKRILITLLVAIVAGVASCSSILDKQREARPLYLRDVPAQRLAYRLEPDVTLPREVATEEANDKIEAIQLDFNTRRQNDALVKTVRSPDGQRALALYGTEDEASHAFKIDLYSSDGSFLRNLTPPEVSCVFPETVSWSPDGTFITFIAHKSVKPTPTPTPPGASTPDLEASPLPSVAPAFAPISVFNTEQIYICNRDGYDLKPLTSREGLIYFYSAWSPDNQAVVAMACKESEWDAREREYMMPAGRPRLITLDGTERLLDDRSTEALPVWSPDAAKVATAFSTDVMIYDVAGNKTTQARIRLQDALLKASRVFEEKSSGGDKKTGSEGTQPGASNPATSPIPASFNPIIRLEWPSPDTLYIQTAYVRLIPNEPISTFQRWHRLTLSPQAALLK